MTENLFAGQTAVQAKSDILLLIKPKKKHALAGISCVTNPDTIILGGEFCKIGKPAMDGIVRAFKKYVFYANENIKFYFADLDTDACICGAFKYVLEN